MIDEEGWNRDENLLLTMWTLDLFRPGEHEFLERCISTGVEFPFEHRHFSDLYSHRSLIRNDGNYKVIGWRPKQKEKP